MLRVQSCLCCEDRPSVQSAVVGQLLLPRPSHLGFPGDIHRGRRAPGGLVLGAAVRSEAGAASPLMVLLRCSSLFKVFR